ncbi:uncharacterized protein LOC106880397 [Octopus bimaculoides]|nr:uncharacterized protein LOC106880397 [Octopus bimaculoides]|eukprot:XP_014785800.1 PREDICTED: uncharacterized protein LOC106880397 [Octopus bimaculoides]
MLFNITPIICALVLCVLFPRGNCNEDTNASQSKSKLNENNVAEQHLDKRSSGEYNPHDLKTIVAAILERQEQGQKQSSALRSMNELAGDQYNGDALSRVVQLLRRSMPSDFDDFERRLAPVPRLGRLKKRSVLSNPNKEVDYDEIEANDNNESADNILFPRQITLPRYGKDEGSDAADAEQYLSSDCEVFDAYGTCVQYKIPGENVKRQVRMLRLGKRQMHPIKIDDESTGMDKRSEDFNADGNSGENKRAVSMLRLGRSFNAGGQSEENEIPVFDEAKRAVSMLRLGRSGPFLDKRALSMLRLGRSEFDQENTALPILYPGQNGFENNKRAVSMLRLGRSMSAGDKRAVSMLRLGRSGFDTMKRAVSMLRLGRNSGYPSEKRAVSMLRLGRSGSDEDKRAVSMLRLGRSGADIEDEKRAVSMLRLGRSGADNMKRAVSMLRLGRSGSDDMNTKRAVSMLRLGRSGNDNVGEDKRAVSMLRLGRSDNNANNKRAMAMLRLGRSNDTSSKET